MSTCFAGLPWGLSGQEFTCQCRRHCCDPRVGKIPWRRKWQPTPGFLPGKPHGQRSLAGYSDGGHKIALATEQQWQLALLNKASYSNNICSAVTVNIYNQLWCVLSRSIMSDSVQSHGLQPTKLLYTWGFSRQEYWSGLPCPPPGDLPSPRLNPCLPHCRHSLYHLSHQGISIDKTCENHYRR